MPFFFLSFLLASFLQFSQVLFNNNYLTAKPVLWIGLMVALPLGAAWSFVKESFRVSALRWLLASVLWCLVGNLLYVQFVGPWESTRAGFLLAKMAMLFGVESLLGTVFFCPMWFCFGAVEFDLYRTLENASDRRQLRSYVLALVGVAVSTAVGSFLLPSRSPEWLLVLSLVSIAALVASRKPSRKLPAWSDALMILFILVLGSSRLYVMHPAIEDRASSSLKPLAFDEWGRFCRLSIAETENAFLGFYDSIVHWMTPKSESSAPFYTAVDKKVFALVPERSRVAILGAGGGAQLPPALLANPEKVVALDLHPKLPSVLKSLNTPGMADPRVDWRTQDARKYLENSNKPFDLIYLPMTESFLRLASHVFEPGDHLHTLEAFRTYREKLSPTGIVAVRKLVDFDRFGPIVSNYARTMSEAGLHVWVWRDKSQFALFGSPTTRAGEAIAKQFPDSKISTASGGKTLLDDKPFFASAAFTPKVIWTFGLIVCLLIGTLAWTFRGNFVSEDIPPLLCGINYTLLLLTFQLLLFYSMSNPLQSQVMGSLVIISLCGLGALVAQRPFVLIIAASIAAAIAYGTGLSPGLIAVGTAAFLSGGFFPAMLGRNRHRIARLLLWDGLGAAIAGGLYLWIPVALGVRWLTFFSILFFTLTAYRIYAHGCLFASARVSPESDASKSSHSKVFS